MNDSNARKRGTLSAADKSVDGPPVPNSDAELFLASQRKNIEGLMRASQVALDGAVAVWRRQLDFAENAAKRYSELATGLDQKRGLPGEQLTTCVEFFKQDFEENLLNARALLELSTRASRDSMQIVGERLDTSLGEVLRTPEHKDA